MDMRLRCCWNIRTFCASHVTFLCLRERVGLGMGSAKNSVTLFILWISYEHTKRVRRRVIPLQRRENCTILKWNLVKLDLDKWETCISYELILRCQYFGTKLPLLVGRSKPLHLGFVHSTYYHSYLNNWNSKWILYA